MSGWQISFMPVLGWPIFWVAACIATVLAFLLVYLNRRGWPLRVAGLALVLAALANPIINADEREQLTDIVAVVVDESASQALGDRRAMTETALRDVERRITDLGNTEIRLGRTVTGATPDTDGTRVFAALAKLRESIPPERYAGAIIITDGQVHDVPKLASPDLAKAPIHAFVSGSKRETDRRVIIEQAPRFVIAGKEQPITFRVEDTPAATEAVDITIRLPDGSEETLSLPANTPHTFNLKIERAGQNVVEIEAAPRENEVSLLNNRAVAVVKGIRDRLRVLLVSGEPHPGERTWRDLLKSDAAVDLVHFTILRPPEKQDGTLTRELSLIAFPTRELFIDKINSFDLVIFDRYRMQSILPEAYLANVAQYVRQGGAVLISSGPDLTAVDGLYASPLAEVMAASPTGDVTEETFRPNVTKDGLRHPVSKNLPGSNADGEETWGRWFRVIDATAAVNTNTLLDGPEGKPLLVLGHVDQGRVAQFLSDQGWLWARGFDGGGPQMELLRRLAHWLMKEPDLEEEALLIRKEGENVVVERRTMADTAVDVTLTAPDGKSQVLALSEQAPGIFTNRITTTMQGIYKATDGTLTTVAAVGNSDDKEAGNVIATTDVLAPIVAASRGGCFWIEEGVPRLSKAEAGNLMAGNSWAALRDNKQFKVTAVRETSLFSTLLSLALLLLLLAGMWYREGR
jgi:uncharacterized membrane protein